mmetsp:Transcript_14390/g.16334  ORF Transcript_14390/g.16334 Transcript_14390/m.16334 type:complete len:146 (-) Transcript_14390:72-509(-)
MALEEVDPDSNAVFVGDGGNAKLYHESPFLRGPYVQIHILWDNLRNVGFHVHGHNLQKYPVNLHVWNFVFLSCNMMVLQKHSTALEPYDVTVDIDSNRDVFPWAVVAVIVYDYYDNVVDDICCCEIDDSLRLCFLRDDEVVRVRL